MTDWLNTYMRVKADLERVSHLSGESYELIERLLDSVTPKAPDELSAWLGASPAERRSRWAGAA